MALYKVAVEVEFYMEAEDEDSAHFDAEDYAREALGDGGDTIVNVDPARPERIPPEWMNSLPYGGDGERTIRQILAAPEPDPAPAPDTLTREMFPAPAPSAGEGGTRHE